MAKIKNVDLTQKVMEKIRKEKVKMKPRVYFVIGSLFLGAGLAAALLLALFFLNLFFFRLRIHQPFGFLLLGRFGLSAFLAHFPWWPVILAIAGLLGGLTLLQRYDFTYKRSFLGVVIGLIAFVFTLGFLFDRLGFNRRMERVKPLRPFYQRQSSDKNWLAGEVLKVEGQHILVKTPQGEIMTVVLNDQTKAPTGREFVIGDQIRAVGEKQNSFFKAKGIIKDKPFRERKLPPPLY